MVKYLQCVERVSLWLKVEQPRTYSTCNTFCLYRYRTYSTCSYFLMFKCVRLNEEEIDRTTSCFCSVLNFVKLDLKGAIVPLNSLCRTPFVASSRVFSPKHVCVSLFSTHITAQPDTLGMYDNLQTTSIKVQQPFTH